MAHEILCTTSIQRGVYTRGEHHQIAALANLLNKDMRRLESKLADRFGYFVMPREVLRRKITGFAVFGFI